MRFAIQVAGGQVRQDATGIEVIVEQTVAAEALGFDTVFVPDHYAFETLGKLRREAEHGLSLLAVNFGGIEQVREFGEKVIARI